jgi:hypothetical protein
MPTASVVTAPFPSAFRRKLHTDSSGHRGADQFSATLGWQSYCYSSMVHDSSGWQYNCHPNKHPILTNCTGPCGASAPGGPPSVPDV